MFGAAIETIVWSMKVIATAKIIAARTSERERPPTGGIFTDPRCGRVTELLPPHGPLASSLRVAGGEDHRRNLRLGRVLLAHGDVDDRHDREAIGTESST